MHLTEQKKKSKVRDVKDTPLAKSQIIGDKNKDGLIIYRTRVLDPNFKYDYQSRKNTRSLPSNFLRGLFSNNSRNNDDKDTIIDPVALLRNNNTGKKQRPIKRDGDSQEYLDANINYDNKYKNNQLSSPRKKQKKT